MPVKCSHLKPGLHAIATANNKNDAEKAAINFVVHWMENSVNPTLLPLLAQGSLDVSADKDKSIYDKTGNLSA